MARPIRILLVEDNPADADLTLESLEQSTITRDLQVVSDGVKAMQYLRREGSFADASRPDLVLLDLNLPRKDGRAVLQEMKGDPELRRIPVVVLTSSKAESDIANSYELQASAYVTKPVDLDGFLRIVHGIESFWLSVVRFPPDEEG